LIKIAAAGENPADWKIREGHLKDEMPVRMPYTMGYDIAGTIEDIGSGVDDFKIGDEVFGMVAGGGYAEYVLAYHNKIALKPKTIDMIQAASIPTAALTAWQAFFEVDHLSPGQKVLILGASGGVGSFAVQFAKWRGAQVVATASKDANAFVKDLGADVIVDYENQRFEDVAKDIDLVLDLIGGETLARAYSTLRKGGILISTVEEPSHDRAHALGINVVSMFVHPKAEQLKRIAGLVDQNLIKTYVTQVLPFEQARKAQEISQKGHVQGKIVLKVA
jgi:NADPH:quinone reductase-like Zn-dependent oxidoreductase